MKSGDERLLAAESTDARIKAHYLSLPGKTEEGWREVKSDPRKYNRVWRRLLGLPPGETPPGFEDSST